MQKYIVQVTYTFSGHYIVLAESQVAAKRKINQDCGVVLGGDIHSTLEDEEIEWDFSIHPELAIVSTKRLKQKK